MGLLDKRLSINYLKYFQKAKGNDIQRTKENHENDREYLIENINKERNYKKEPNRNSRTEKYNKGSEKFTR